MSAIAPIQGTLKKRIISDIVTGFALGGVMGSYWWWGYHKGVIGKREAFYSQLAEQKKAEAAGPNDGEEEN
ncbi:cytochrome c oxidase subunit 7A [Zygosaccharomyces mellis]|uniref:Cytochrome c oxidase subunit 9, mitochondrial n=1 Tax=Zygosaccharomyces mellis TaxID=42258 RepID=A0A4C2E4Q5_9SACH|nr:cytochrome c oxidase subunit 7A [Zygosaccharomyces mellis]